VGGRGDALVRPFAGQGAGDVSCLGRPDLSRRDNDLLLWKRETFKFSTDPEPDAKVRDVVDLYLSPPVSVVT
jgi:hypothetical protein